MFSETTRGLLKILFTTDRRDGPSTMWYESQLRGLQAMPGIEIDFYSRDYSGYDVVLFMGYDPRIEEAKAMNRGVIVGVIDARPAAGREISGADCLIANGIEMYDWYARDTAHVFIYPPYPVLPLVPRTPAPAAGPVVLGYHGNKVHLQAMYPRVTQAIEALAENHKVEIWALYNIRSHGKWEVGTPNHGNVKIRHIQWTENGYEELLAGTDIGIVPNFIPLRRKLWGDSASISKRTFNDDETDYLTRYKSTSNAGRIFVFAQQGIPVVSDMFPSALQLIEHGVDGFLCYSGAAWHRALASLASDPELLSNLGERLLKKYEQRWSPEVLNRLLVDFLRSLPRSQAQFGPGVKEFRERPGGWSYLRDVKTSEVRATYSRVSRHLKSRLGRTGC